MSETLSLPCECGSELLFVEPQDSYDLDEGLYISIWKHAYERKSFWYRFRHMWQILRHGTPYTDQICLDIDKVIELYTYLVHFLNKREEECPESVKN